MRYNPSASLSFENISKMEDACDSRVIKKIRINRQYHINITKLHGYEFVDSYTDDILEYGVCKSKEDAIFEALKFARIYINKKQQKYTNILNIIDRHICHLRANKHETSI